jgi:hypothetical protein
VRFYGGDAVICKPQVLSFVSLMSFENSMKLFKELVLEGEVRK